jgi:anaerobic magnesium-protoporphyrin IX monomethyl ester cyclase
MRLAGCQRLSPRRRVGLAAHPRRHRQEDHGRRDHRQTEMAKKAGIKVRYYMMLGNRGETAETFKETLAFLERARPHEYVFSCLSHLPRHPRLPRRGGRRLARARGLLQPALPGAQDAVRRQRRGHASSTPGSGATQGLRTAHREGVAELYRHPREARRPPRGPHGPRRSACYDERATSTGAERHVRAPSSSATRCRASPSTPRGIAKRRGDVDGMMDLFSGPPRSRPPALHAHPQREPRARLVRRPRARAWPAAFARGAPRLSAARAHRPAHPSRAAAAGFRGVVRAAPGRAGSPLPEDPRRRGLDARPRAASSFEGAPLTP